MIPKMDWSEIQSLKKKTLFNNIINYYLIAGNGKFIRFSPVLIENTGKLTGYIEFKTGKKFEEMK